MTAYLFMLLFAPMLGVIVFLIFYLFWMFVVGLIRMIGRELNNGFR